MTQKEFEERIKSPAIQTMILSHQIGGVAYELSKRLNVSPARALDLFYRSQTCADLHNRNTGLYLYGNLTQASRQKEFEQLRTTDDHVMEIIGTFMKGKQRFYVCRTSWGKNWGNKGLIYLSEDYLRLKTIAVFMSEDAYIMKRHIYNKV